jgi:predicted nucleic acid-binding protein
MGTTDERAVVVDAGPLIHLDELGCLDILGDMAPLVTPEVVWNETRRHRPRMQIDHIPGLRAVPVDRAPSPKLIVFADTLGLAAGETAALALAEQQRLVVFLTDDSAARLAGEALGFRVHGTIGMLLRSIRRGMRSRSEELDILASLRERSSLHIAPNLLAEVVIRVKAE